jgi:hypothetical protein
MRSKNYRFYTKINANQPALFTPICGKNVFASQHILNQDKFGRKYTKKPKQMATSHGNCCYIIIIRKNWLGWEDFFCSGLKPLPKVANAKLIIEPLYRFEPYSINLSQKNRNKPGIFYKLAVLSDQIITESPIFIYLNQQLITIQACQKPKNLSRFLMIL